MSGRVMLSAFVIALSCAAAAAAQTHEHPPAPPRETSTWQVMHDGVVFGLFNHQGGPRGGTELRVPNWWMGMFSRKVKSTDFTINTMVSGMTALKPTP